MTLRNYIVLMLSATIISWLAFWLVISELDPTQASWIVFVSFYATIFLALIGTFAVVGLGFRLYILRHEIILRQVMIAFRQAISFSFLVIAALFLQSQDILYWWNLLFLIVALTFIECAVLLRQRTLPPI